MRLTLIAPARTFTLGDCLADAWAGNKQGGLVKTATVGLPIPLHPEPSGVAVKSAS